MKLNKYLPTGYPTIDILGGQNKRDLNGNLIEIQRGHKLGTQICIAAAPGIGKTTLALDMASIGYHVGLPLWKIIYIDADRNDAEENRYSMLTNFTDEEREKYLEVVDKNFLEDIADYLSDVDARYKAEKFKPQTINSIMNPNEKMQMMPYTVVIIDTVTSLKSEKYSLGGEKNADATANQQGMTEGRLKGDIANSITNICDGNVLVIWLAHLKKNTPEMGKTIPKKAYKSSPIDITDSVPEKIRAKAAQVYWLIKPEDANNQDSSQHPKYIYGYQEDGGKIYQVTIVAVKSRSSTENRSPMKLVYEGSKFNNMTSLIATLYNSTDKLVKASGQFPNADNPSIFKDSGEFKVPKRDALKLEGYNYPTNLVEARLLVNYTGNNPDILKRKALFLQASLSSLEDYYSYELESNNTTYDEIQSNKTNFTSIYSFISSVTRKEYISPEEKKEIGEISLSKVVNDQLSYDDI